MKNEASKGQSNKVEIVLVRESTFIFQSDPISKMLKVHPIDVAAI